MTQKYGTGNSDSVTYYLPKALANVTITTVDRSLSEWAFNECAQLTQITLPAEKKDIPNYTFKNCTGLLDFNFINCVSIGISAFEGCTGISAANFTAPRVQIGNSAFKSCTNLADLNFVDLLSLGDYAFAECTKLGSRVILPENTQSLGWETFSGCTSLIRIRLGNNITEIPNKCFYGCRHLKEVILSNKLTSIGSQAFYNCVGSHEQSIIKEGLQEIEIPATTYFIAADAFKTNIPSAD